MSARRMALQQPESYAFSAAAEKEIDRPTKIAPEDTHQPEAILPSSIPLVFEGFLPSLTLWLSPNCSCTSSSAG